MPTLEKTAFGGLFDKLSPSGSISDYELWGAMSRAYASKAADQLSKKFNMHAFVAEGAQTSGIFVNIEMRKLHQLTKKTAPVFIDFYAVVAALGESPYKADFRFTHKGQQGACDHESTDVKDASGAMQNMTAAAAKKNNERRGKTPDTGEATPGSSS